MTTPLPDDDRRRAIEASNRRWRSNFTALAVVVPLVLAALFHRQGERLRDLASHGRLATATITDRRSGGAYYAYTVDGHAYDWNVRAADAPFPLGARFSITYLPADPSLSRPVWPYTAANLAAERHAGITVGVPTGLFVFFALSALLCHRALRRARAGVQSTPRPTVSPVLSGRLVAALLLACVLGVNLDPAVQSIARTLWGDAPAGVPIMLVVSLAQTVLFAPAFWVFPELMRIVQARLAAGGSVTRAGILAAVVTAGPKLRHARDVVLAGGVYFAILLGLWIAYAAHRGV